MFDKKTGNKQARLSPKNTIVIYSMGFIGDVLISLRFAAALKNSSGNFKVVIIVPPALVDIAQSIKQIDDVIPYDKRNENSGSTGIEYIVNAINKFKPDFYINLHPGFRSSKIAAKVRVKIQKLRYNTSQGKFIYLGKSIKYIKGIHELERLKSFYNLITQDEYKPYCNIEYTNTTKSRVDMILAQTRSDQKAFYLIFPGSVWPTKRYTPKGFTDLSNELAKNGQVYICGTESEKSLTAHIVENSDAIDLAGSLKLVETAYLVSQSDRVYSNDSAPTHLANLHGTPVTTIFGPTSPYFGFYPTGERDKIVYKGLDCSPCSIHGTIECPLGHHKCMESISIKEII
jgi:heptosyltransferase-2